MKLTTTKDTLKIGRSYLAYVFGHGDKDEVAIDRIASIAFPTPNQLRRIADWLGDRADEIEASNRASALRTTGKPSRKPSRKPSARKGR